MSSGDEGGRRRRHAGSCPPKSEASRAPGGTRTGSDQAVALAAAVGGIIAALLVAGRNGAPAEGRIPFNPLSFHLLRRLDENGPTRPSVLADTLGVSRTTVSTALKALQGRGLVTTEPDPEDGRAHAALLTDEGRDVLGAIRRQDLRNAEAMLTSLDPDERDAFVSAAAKVAEGLVGASPARPG